MKKLISAAMSSNHILDIFYNLNIQIFDIKREDLLFSFLKFLIKQMNEITLSSFLSRLNERNKTEKYHRNENRKQKKEPILKVNKLFCQNDATKLLLFL